MGLARLPRLTLVARSGLLLAIELVANGAVWAGAGVVLTGDGVNLLGLGILAWVSARVPGIVGEGYAWQP
jgi:hypothetical protein